MKACYVFTRYFPQLPVLNNYQNKRSRTVMQRNVCGAPHPPPSPRCEQEVDPDPCPSRLEHKHRHRTSASHKNPKDDFVHYFNASFKIKLLTKKKGGKSHIDVKKTRQ